MTPEEYLDQKTELQLLRGLLEYPQLMTMVSSRLTAQNLSTMAKRVLYSALVEYYKDYDSRPTKDVVDIVIEEMYPPGDADVAMKLHRNLRNKEPAPYKWLLSHINTAISDIQLHKGLADTASAIQQGRKEDARRLVRKAVETPPLSTALPTQQLDLSRADLGKVFSEHKDSFCFPTRIHALDKIIKGLSRKELTIVMAPLNVGKSWAVIHLAISALTSGKKVLYLTLEMSEERVMQRILKSVGGTAAPNLDDEILDEEELMYSLTNLKRCGGELSLKEYPSGEARIGDIERDIEMYNAMFGGYPDVIVVDGMRDLHITVSEKSELRMKLADLARKLRSFASNYNAAVITTHQGNRESMTKNTVRAEHSGESIDVMQVADVGFSLNQTREEYAKQTMRLHIVRARNAAKWGTIEMSQNFDLGQFCTGSWEHVK